MDITLEREKYWSCQRCWYSSRFVEKGCSDVRDIVMLGDVVILGKDGQGNNNFLGEAKLGDVRIGDGWDREICLGT